MLAFAAALRAEVGTLAYRGSAMFAIHKSKDSTFRPLLLKLRSQFVFDELLESCDGLHPLSHSTVNEESRGRLHAQACPFLEIVCNRCVVLAAFQTFGKRPVFELKFPRVLIKLRQRIVG